MKATTRILLGLILAVMLSLVPMTASADITPSCVNSDTGAPPTPSYVIPTYNWVEFNRIQICEEHEIAGYPQCCLYKHIAYHCTNYDISDWYRTVESVMYPGHCIIDIPNGQYYYCSDAGPGFTFPGGGA